MSYIDSHEPQPWIGEEVKRKWKGTQYGRDGYTAMWDVNWWKKYGGTGTYVGESKTSSKHNIGKVKGSTRYWDGTKWSKDAPTSIPMIELKPAYNDTSKPGISESVPDSNLQGDTTDVSGDESFAQAGASNIVDRFGLGDAGSPRRKRGRGMSAALGVI